MGRARRPVTKYCARAAAAVVLVVACGGSEPGILSIQLDAYPGFTKATSVVVTGVVTRTPVKDTRIIVKATGGGSTATPTDTADGTGHFTLMLPLSQNTNNKFSVSATDKDGSTGDPVDVTIRADNQAPVVSQATPSNGADSVPLNTSTIQERMSEATILGVGGGIELSRQGVVVPGTTSISADSLTLTYTTQAVLSPNAIYRVGFTGATDAAGNSVTSSSCFVTTPAGATATAEFSDSTNDLFTGGSGPPPLPPDLVDVRFAREGDQLSGVFKFVGPRLFSITATSGAAIVIDLDTDQDSTTGNVSLKDYLFSTNFPQLSSGTGPEYIIGLEPNSDLGDSAYVGAYAALPDSAVFQPEGLFLPGTCGPFMGFVVPFSALGNDDGNMDGVILALAQSATFIFGDPVPTKGHFTLNLTAPGPAPDQRTAFVPAPHDRRARAGSRISRYLSRR